MNFISICSGIDAASVAFVPIGWKAIAFSEIEPFPCAALAHHYPEVPNFGDMTRFREWPEAVFANADAIVGGPPCQAFSVAGLRNGLNDDRGNLTLIYAEIIDHADAVRARFGRPPVVVLYENVPGLLSDKTGAYGCFLGALAGEDGALVAPGGKWTDAGCVFGPQRTIAWRLFDAQYHAVAQRRRRVFVVASARDGFDPAAVLFEFDGVRRDTAPSREAREVASTIPSRSLGGGGLGTDFDCDGGLVQVCPTLRAGGNRTGGDRPPGTDVDTADSLITVSYAIQAGTLRSTEGGSDVDHAKAGHIQPVITMAHGQGGAEIASDRRTTITCNHEAPIAVYPVAHVETMPCMTAGGPGESSHNQVSGQMREQYVVPVCVTGDITHTLKSEGFDASEDGTGRGQPIVTYANAGEFGGLKEVSVSDQLRAKGGDTGSGGESLVCVHGTQDPCSDEHVAFALGRNSGQENAIAFNPNQEGMGLGDIATPIGASTGGGNQGGNIIQVAMKVRRLTPRECERLQGFPDDYTLIPYGRPSKAKLDADFLKYQLRGNQKHLTRDDIWRLAADGPRYKALGNSWAIPCVSWIGKRIDSELNGGRNGR